MVEVENFDISTTTLGISLFDIAGGDPGVPERVYNRILQYGSKLVETAQSVEEDLGMPIINKRVSVTPVAWWQAAVDETDGETAKALDAAAKDIGIDYIAGYSALVHKGIRKATAFISLPDAINHRTAAPLAGQHRAASTWMPSDDGSRHSRNDHQADADGVGCVFVVFSNAVEDNPFIAGAMHGVGEPQAVLNVGTAAPVLFICSEAAMQNPPPNMDLGNIADVIKRMAFKCTRAGQVVGRVVAQRLGVDMAWLIYPCSNAGGRFRSRYPPDHGLERWGMDRQL